MRKFTQASYIYLRVVDWKPSGQLRQTLRCSRGRGASRGRQCERERARESERESERTREKEKAKKSGEARKSERKRKSEREKERKRERERDSERERGMQRKSYPVVLAEDRSSPSHRGTSFIRKRFLLGPYSRAMLQTQC